MTREGLQDAFTRAEGAENVAFRQWLRAKRGGPQRAALRHGRAAYAQLELAAAQISLDRDKR